MRELFTPLQIRHPALDLLRGHAPRVAFDLVLMDNRYQYRVELPGFKKENIQIALDEGHLVVRAKHEASEEKFLIKERNYVSLSRELPLPEDADTNSIEASYDNGLLLVTAQKSAPVPQKTITVN